MCRWRRRQGSKGHVSFVFYAVFRQAKMQQMAFFLAFRLKMGGEPADFAKLGIE
jgi:hypothetical protein